MVGGRLWSLMRHLVSFLPCAWVASRGFSSRGGGERIPNAPHPQAIGSCHALGWRGRPGSEVAGWMLCPPPPPPLLLHPRPKGWFIFRFKTRAFLSALLNLLLGAGAVCPGRVWGDIPGEGAGEEHQSRDLWVWQHLRHPRQQWAFWFLSSSCSQQDVVHFIKVQLYVYLA